MTGKTDQTFSFEIVTCLLAAMSESGVSVGAKQYALMAKIDGSKTASGYEHMFRAAKNKAKDINQKISTGELEIGAGGAKGKGASSGGGTPVKGKGGSKTATPASGAKKRGRKAASELEGDDEESPTKKTKKGDDDESPTKKMKEEKTEEDEWV